MKKSVYYDKTISKLTPSECQKFLDSIVQQKGNLNTIN